MMNRVVLIAALLVSCAAWGITQFDASPVRKTLEHASRESEARSRAMLLHEMTRGTLQIMHRDFFDEDDAHLIPSASLEDVFHEMGESCKVKIVNTDIVNVDHKAESEFDNDAVRMLAAGKPFHELVTANRYQFAGPIRLQSQCLKCHVQRRSDSLDRIAGLVISMPLSKPTTD